MGTNVDDIITKFPIKVLPKIIGEPDFGEINNMAKDLYGDAEMIPSTLRVVQPIHIEINMIPLLYGTLYKKPYTVPEVPEATENTPKGIIAEEQEQIWVDHKLIIKTFINLGNTEISMKTLLL